MIHEPRSSTIPSAEPAKPRAVLVLSGGLDSAVTGFLAAKESELVAAVHFSYGQRHAVESRCAGRVAAALGVRVWNLAVGAFSSLGDSALVKSPSCADVNKAHRASSHLPASFVPGRNLTFITLAAALAYKLDATEVWTGVCQTDASGYPDCRSETMRALEVALRCGMDYPFTIRTPLLYATKAATFGLADQLDRLEFVLEETHTCYEGDRSTRYPWGYGCSKCPACKIRADGWAEFSDNRKLLKDIGDGGA